jgi:hypothetical protein
MVSFDAIRAWAHELPGVEEGTSYGTPALRVCGKLLVRLRDEDGAMVLKVVPEVRDLLLATNPDTFYTTPHYEGYPTVLVRLGTADPDDLRDLLIDAWRDSASKRLIAEYEHETSGH